MSSQDMSYILHMFSGLSRAEFDDTVSSVGHVDFDGTVMQCSGGTPVNGMRADSIAGFDPTKNNIIFTDSSEVVVQIQFGTDKDGVWWRVWKEDRMTEDAIIKSLVEQGFSP